MRPAVIRRAVVAGFAVGAAALAIQIAFAHRGVTSIETDFAGWSSQNHFDRQTPLRTPGGRVVSAGPWSLEQSVDTLRDVHWVAFAPARRLVPGLVLSPLNALARRLPFVGPLRRVDVSDAAVLVRTRLAGVSLQGARLCFFVLCRDGGRSALWVLTGQPIDDASHVVEEHRLTLHPDLKEWTLVRGLLAPDPEPGEASLRRALSDLDWAFGFVLYPVAARLATPEVPDGWTFDPGRLPRGAIEFERFRLDYRLR